MKFDHEHYWPLAPNEILKKGDEYLWLNNWVPVSERMIGYRVDDILSHDVRRRKPALYKPPGLFNRMRLNFWNLIKEIEEHQLR